MTPNPQIQRGGAIALFEAIKLRSPAYRALKIHWVAVKRRDTAFRFKVSDTGEITRVEVNTRIFDDPQIDGVSTLKHALQAAFEMQHGLTSAIAVRDLRR